MDLQLSGTSFRTPVNCMNTIYRCPSLFFGKRFITLEKKFITKEWKDVTGANCKCFFLFTFSFKFFGINPSKNFSYEYTKTSSLSLVGLVTFSDRVVRRRKTKGRIPLQTCFATVLPSFFSKTKRRFALHTLHSILFHLLSNWSSQTKRDFHFRIILHTYSSFICFFGRRERKLSGVQTAN